MNFSWISCANKCLSMRTNVCVSWKTLALCIRVGVILWMCMQDSPACLSERVHLKWIHRAACQYIQLATNTWKCAWKHGAINIACRCTHQAMQSSVIRLFANGGNNFFSKDRKNSFRYRSSYTAVWSISMQITEWIMCVSMRAQTITSSDIKDWPTNLHSSHRLWVIFVATLIFFRPFSPLSPLAVARFLNGFSSCMLLLTYIDIICCCQSLLHYNDSHFKCVT